MSTVLSQLKYFIFYSLSVFYKDGTNYGYRKTSNCSDDFSVLKVIIKWQKKIIRY